MCELGYGAGVSDESEVPDGGGEPKKRGLLEYSKEDQERWAALRQQDERRRRRRKTVVWSLVGVLVLGVAGVIAKPSLKDMYIESGACDGAIPDGSMDTLRATTGESGAHLAEESAELDTQLGRYTCEVENEEGERVVEAEVYSSRDDIDRELARQFTDDGGRPRAALPGGLPGFEGKLSGIILMPDCPGRGKDAAGHRAQLLVEVYAGHLSKPRQVLRVGAALANKASQKLGCHAKPLRVPAEGVAAKTVDPARAGGTSCAALAKSPLRGSGWVADIRTPDGRGPMASCTVRPKGLDRNGEPHGAVLELDVWYGDWSRRMMLYQARQGGAGGDREKEKVRPWLTGEGGWATAECDGQAAGFQLAVRRPDEDEGAAEDTGEASVSRGRLGKGEMRAMLASFAKSQARERGCHGLRLPPAPR